jgi:hypothetical protein
VLVASVEVPVVNKLVTVSAPVEDAYKKERFVVEAFTVAKSVAVAFVAKRFVVVAFVTTEEVAKTF